jgi:hypothetical protein
MRDPRTGRHGEQVVSSGQSAERAQALDPHCFITLLTCSPHLYPVRLSVR